MGRLLGALPSGSYLVLNDGTDTDPVVVEAIQVVYQSPNAANPYYLRSPEQIARFFDGLELVEPGMVSTSQWRPEPSVRGDSAESVRLRRGRPQTVTSREMKQP